MLKNKIAKLISEDLNNSDRIERKQIDCICEACTKVIQQCSKKELKVADLKWQPHYSTVFKQLKSQLECILSSDSSKTLDKLNTIPYLLALKNEIIGLLNNFSKFVIENGSLIGSKDSNQRKNFFIKVVHFQFLCHEIQAYFPSGAYLPSKCKISKLPARVWWEKMFGEITFVDIDMFVNKFKEDYPFINQAEIFSFKNSINFTSTNFTTTFEFDLFTRLYSPWEIIQQAWRLIYYHPAYLHFSTYGDTKDILSQHLDKPGTYVFRVSCKDLGYWTIGYVKGSKDMGQIKVDKTNLIEALVEGRKKNMYVYPNGELCNPDLSNLSEFRKEIVVKNEDLQLYDCFEDFKECKICRESEKDLQMESCGHQICHACFKLLRKYDKKLCPFCNQKILSTTKIVNIQTTYVEHNPAQTIEKHENDSLYVDMKLDNKEDTDSNGTTYTRVNSTKLTRDSDGYSNISDEVRTPVYESPSFPLPDIPARPAREKPTFQAYEINYPPMNKTKIEDTQSYQVTTGSTSGNSNVRPQSSIYADMVLNTDVMVDELYSEVNDPDDNNRPSDSVHVPVTSGATATYPGPESTKAAVSNHVTVTGGAMATRSAPWYSKATASDSRPTAASLPLVDDTYLTPNDLIVPQLDNDIYCDPIMDNMEDGDDEDGCVYLLPNINHGPTATIAKQPFLDDVYSNIDDDVVGHPDPFFSSWTDHDVARAMKVARNDKQLAKEILQEFVDRA